MQTSGKVKQTFSPLVTSRIAIIICLKGGVDDNYVTCN